MMLSLISLLLSFFTAVASPSLPVSSADSAPHYSAALSIAEDSVIHIVMVREACPGRCPVYGVRFDRNGHAVYQGMENVRRKGTYIGRISKRDFNNLVKLSENASFWQMKRDYLVTSERFPTTTTTIVRTETYKEVRSHSSGPVAIAPPLLRQLQDAIDATIEDISWTKVEEEAEVADEEESFEGTSELEEEESDSF